MYAHVCKTIAGHVRFISGTGTRSTNGMCAEQSRDFLDLARFISGTGRVTRIASGSHNAPADVDEPNVGDLPQASVSNSDTVATQWSQVK